MLKRISLVMSKLALHDVGVSCSTHIHTYTRERAVQIAQVVALDPCPSEFITGHDNPLKPPGACTTTSINQTLIDLGLAWIVYRSSAAILV